jgi:hypothetical protein
VVFRHARDRTHAPRTYAPRTLSELTEQEGLEAGFLFLDPDGTVDFNELAAVEDWVETDADGNARVRRSAREAVPRRVRVTPDGREVEDELSREGIGAWYFPAPFRYCFECRVVYASERARDFGKLAELATEGRSTATTILSLSTVRALRGDQSLPVSARNPLSFTDNRQDASLQAGHFNDFVQVSLLRAALLAAVRDAGPRGLRHDEVAPRTAEKMALDFAAYSANPEARFNVRRNIEEALRDVVGYLGYNDLRRGWRVTSPNLEQVRLLHIEYESLEELCTSGDVREKKHEYLKHATSQQRMLVAQCSIICADRWRSRFATCVLKIRPASKPMRTSI